MLLQEIMEVKTFGSFYPNGIREVLLCGSNHGPMDLCFLVDIAQLQRNHVVPVCLNCTAVCTFDLQRLARMLSEFADTFCDNDCYSAHYIVIILFSNSDFHAHAMTGRPGIILLYETNSDYCPYPPVRV